MNVWPPKELWKTIVAIGLPIVLAPIVAILEVVDIVNKFSNNEIVSIGDFGKIVLLVLFSLIASGGIIYFFRQMIMDAFEDENNKLDDKISVVVFSVILGYLAISFAIFVFLKLLYNY